MTTRTTCWVCQKDKPKKDGSGVCPSCLMHCGMLMFSTEPGHQLVACAIVAGMKTYDVTNGTKKERAKAADAKMLAGIRSPETTVV